MDIYKVKYDKNINNEDLIIKARSGDIAAKELLFQNNIPFIIRLAKKWIRMGSVVDIDELVSIGFIGMTKAYNRFDATKGCLFIGLVKLCVLNEFKNHAEYSKTVKLSKYGYISLDEVNEDTETDLHEKASDDKYAYENDAAIYKAELSKIENIVKEIGNAKEKEVFYKYYYLDLPFNEISKQMNLSRERVSQIHEKLIEWTKRIINIQKMAL